MEFIDLKKQQVLIRKKLENRIQNVLEHGKYIMGPEVLELEEKLASYTNTKHCISCSSGTDALLIPLMAKGIGPGDAVLTTPFTYIATAEVIALLGATPIFIDIYPSTFNMNPAGIDKAIKEAKEKGLLPKAIIPVDLFGLPARYRLIKEKSKEYNLFLLEDAAQGFGGTIKGKKAGSFGDAASTSFFPAKPLGCYGDGGAIFTDDDKLADKMRSIRVHGSGIDKYDNVRIGINGRLDTIQAAILLEKLSIFDNELTLRNNSAYYYTKNLSNKVQKPIIPSEYFSSWAQYSVVLNVQADRDDIIKEMRDKGIPLMVYYKIPLHLQAVYKNLGYKNGEFPVSENISQKIISLPMHPYLNKKTQDKVISSFNSFI